MTVSAELERTVCRLDNHNAAIYTMISGLAGTQRRHGHRLDAILELLRVRSARLSGRSRTMNR